MMEDMDVFDFRREASQALSELRKESLDVYNRIHSIVEDVQFVNDVHREYPNLPILPNLRCGAWYVDPTIATQEPAYFKSTDGHFGNWNFNLRRPNLHLLSLIMDNHGMVLVDSTRAGKRIPDALAKTVPIWCAVINRAVSRTYPNKSEWSSKLYTPPGAVSDQESAQIEARLDAWADSLIASVYTLPDLPFPLRPLWITPSTSTFPQLPAEGRLGFLPVVCVSASKQIHDGLERRSSGFVYVQGSGDDHELWGMGLTPQLFWQHEKELLSAPRAALCDLVASIVAESSSKSHRHFDWVSLPTPVGKIKDKLFISAIADIPSSLPRCAPNSDKQLSYLLISATLPAPGDGHSRERITDSDTPAILQLRLSEGKKGRLDLLQNVLPQSMSFIEARLNTGDGICICCDNGKDASVGVALAALQLFFDDDGNYAKSPEAQAALKNLASKQSIHIRLQWIIASRPHANPSRATLKRVNEFLLTAPSFRRPRDI